MSKIRRRRHGKTRDGRLLWRMKSCLHLFVTKGECGHYVRFENDGCPTKQADDILANPNSDIQTLLLVKCTRYKDFVRHPTVFFLQIADPLMYEVAIRRPEPEHRIGQPPTVKQKHRIQNGGILWWRQKYRKYKAASYAKAALDKIKKYTMDNAGRFSLPKIRSPMRYFQIRIMSTGKIRKYCRTVNRLKQTFALKLLKDKYGRSRL